MEDDEAFKEEQFAINAQIQSDFSALNKVIVALLKFGQLHNCWSIYTGLLVIAAPWCARLCIFKPSFDPCSLKIREMLCTKVALLVGFKLTLELLPSEIVWKNYAWNIKHCHKLHGNSYLYSILLLTFHFSLFTYYSPFWLPHLLNHKDH